MQGSLSERSLTESRVIVRTGVIILAMVVNLAIILVSRGLVGDWPHVKVQDDIQEIMAGAVVGATLIIGIAAMLVAMLIARVTRRPARTWLIVGTGAWLISLLGVTGARNTSSAITLGLLHTVTAFLLIVAAWRTMPAPKA
ncbi:MAG: DUF6069 family protein [Thermomicrobiales bacterium]